MKKRLLSVLLALCMLLTMLPTTVFAADSGTVETKVRVCYTDLPSTGEVSYWLYQEKVDTNGDVDSTITQTGASANYYNVKWEPATATITLNNINASKVAVNTTGVSFIYLTQGDLNIKLLGANKIGDHEGANLIYAIYTTNADGTVTISGPGSLLTRGGDYTSNTSHSGTPVRIAGNLIIQDGADFTTVCKYHMPQQHGIYVGGDLTIKDRAKLSATRTEIEHTYTREECYALNLGGALTLENEGAIELKTFKPYKGKNTWWYVAWTCNKDITPGLDNYITAPNGLQLPSKQETGIYPRNNIDNVVQIYYSVKANAESHVYDQEVAEGRYLATAATLTSPATYYRSCKCGAYEENKDNTFSYGDLACPVIFNTTSPECDQGYVLNSTTSRLLATTDGSRGSFYYDSAAHTLYLNNFNAAYSEGTLYFGNNDLGDIPYPITVNVTGDCSIATQYRRYAIHSRADLIFEGTGTLTLTASGTDAVYFYTGNAEKSMTVNLPMTIGYTGDYSSAAIYGLGLHLTVNAPLKLTNNSTRTYQVLTIKGGSITIGDPELYIKAGADEASATKYMASDFDESSETTFAETVSSFADNRAIHYIDIGVICHHVNPHKFVSVDETTHNEVCPDCNEVLGTANHELGYTAVAGTNTHKQGCTVCGYDNGGATEEHIATTPATCTKKAVCDKCGAEFGDYAKHTLVNLEDAKYLRSEATDCQSHNTYWLACSACGTSAGEDSNAADKYFEGATVGAHSFTTTYLAENADADKHYHVCTLCSTKDDGEAHKWNVPAATEETAKYCTVCRYIGEEQQAHVHHYNLEVVADKYLISAADCTNAATYHKSCRCGEFEENGESFTVGDPLGHNYVKQEQTAANLRSKAADCREYNTYWLLCDRCNASAKDDVNAQDKHYNGEQGAHVADTANYASSESEHWNVCLYHSDVKMNVTAHTYDQKVMEEKYLASAATCTKDTTYYYSCVCGAKGTETFAKENTALGHDFTKEVKNSDTKKSTAQNCTEHDVYYYSCSRADCNAISDTKTFEGDVGPHVFDQKVTEEKYLASAATCTEDATYYYSCVCGEKGTTTFTKANSALGHQFNKEVKNSDTLKSTAKDCTEHDVYYYSCSHAGCTAVSNIKTFEGEIGSHVADTNYTIAGEKHIKRCVHHPEVVLLEETHTFNQMNETERKDAATCTADATYYYTCVCGAKGTESYTKHGSALGHDYTKMIETDPYLKEAANCTGHNIYWYACSRCDASAKDAANEADRVSFTGSQTTSVGAHVPETTLSHDGNTHWNACQHHPDVKLNETAHSFDQHNTDAAYLVRPATCTEKAVYKLSCVCGEASAETFEYGEALGHSYTEKRETADYVRDEAADCRNHATYWFACSRCGASAKDAANEADRISYTGETEASFGAHDYTELPAEELRQYADETGHYHKVCSDCGGKSGFEEHSWNVPAATEQTDKHCTVCGYVAAEQQGHTFGEAWVSDADGHWHVCTGCGAPSEKAPHQYLTDEDKECSICGRSKVTVEIRVPETTPEVNNPGTGAAVTTVAVLLARISRFVTYFRR